MQRSDILVATRVIQVIGLFAQAGLDVRLLRRVVIVIEVLTMLLQMLNPSK